MRQETQNIRSLIHVKAGRQARHKQYGFFIHTQTAVFRAC